MSPLRQRDYGRLGMTKVTRRSGAAEAIPSYARHCLVRAVPFLLHTPQNFFLSQSVV